MANYRDIIPPRTGMLLGGHAVLVLVNSFVFPADPFWGRALAMAGAQAQLALLGLWAGAGTLKIRGAIAWLGLCIMSAVSFAAYHNPWKIDLEAWWVVLAVPHLFLLAMLGLARCTRRTPAQHCVRWTVGLLMLWTAAVAIFLFTLRLPHRLLDDVRLAGLSPELRNYAYWLLGNHGLLALLAGVSWLLASYPRWRYGWLALVLGLGVTAPLLDHLWEAWVFGASSGPWYLETWLYYLWFQVIVLATLLVWQPVPAAPTAERQS